MLDACETLHQNYKYGDDANSEVTSTETEILYRTTAPDEGEWPAACQGRFTPAERPTGTYWAGGWVDLQGPPGSGDQD
jgi:hypothetical protein